MRRLLSLAALGAGCLTLAGCGSIHLSVGVSAAAQRTLYQQTLQMMGAQQDFAKAHGVYAQHLFDLISDYPQLAALDGNSSPVVDFEVSSDHRGYRFEMADQSSGGAASFTVLVPADHVAQLTCQGPAPLCTDGTFKAPASYWQAPSGK